MRTQLQPYGPPIWHEQPACVPTSELVNRKADGQDRSCDVPNWMDASDPIRTFMRRHAADIEPGWRELAARTLTKLLTVVGVSPQRRGAVAGIRVCSTATELCFWVVSDAGMPDLVCDGIFRKTRCASRALCKQCGRPARVRPIDEEENATLCAVCAAPLLLRQDIWELGQSVRFLKAVNRPVSMSQIPSLLRPSFVQVAIAHATDVDPAKGPQMTPARFVQWAAQWGEVGEAMKLLH